jgi:hypothetical protein
MVTIFGQHDDATIAQLQRCADPSKNFFFVRFVGLGLVDVVST